MKLSLGARSAGCQEFRCRGSQTEGRPAFRVERLAGQFVELTHRNSGVGERSNPQERRSRRNPLWGHDLWEEDENACEIDRIALCPSPKGLHSRLRGAQEKQRQTLTSLPWSLLTSFLLRIAKDYDHIVGSTIGNMFRTCQGGNMPHGALVTIWGIGTVGRRQRP